MKNIFWKNREICGWHSHVCFDRGKKLRVAPESSDLSSQWLNMVASMVNKEKS